MSISSAGRFSCKIHKLWVKFFNRIGTSDLMYNSKHCFACMNRKVNAEISRINAAMVETVIVGRHVYSPRPGSHIMRFRCRQHQRDARAAVASAESGRQANRISIQINNPRSNRGTSKEYRSMLLPLMLFGSRVAMLSISCRSPRLGTKLRI